MLHAHQGPETIQLPGWDLTNRSLTDRGHGEAHYRRRELGPGTWKDDGEGRHAWITATPQVDEMEQGRPYHEIRHTGPWEGLVIWLVWAYACGMFLSKGEAILATKETYHQLRSCLALKSAVRDSLTYNSHTPVCHVTCQDNGLDMYL